MTTTDLKTRKEWWQLVIEWDGQRPPTKWYRRMNELAGKVRGDGDKSKGVIERRLTDEMVEIVTPDGTETVAAGLIVQEGCILCESRGLAELLAAYIQTEVAPMVERQPTLWLGKAELSTEFVVNQRDRQLINRIENVLGRRGKKPDEATHAVACHECADVYLVDAPKGMVVNCPRCRGPLINVRVGTIARFADDGDDIVALWKRTRFFGPHWERARLDGKTPAPAVDALMMSERDEDMVDLIEASPDLLDIVRQIAQDDSREDAMGVLDAIFLARRSHDPQVRLENRVAAIQRYVMTGGNMMNVVIAETPTADIIDASTILRTDRTVGYMVRYIHNGGSH